jgi:hypothetical protein
MRYDIEKEAARLEKKKGFLTAMKKVEDKIVAPTHKALFTSAEKVLFNALFERIYMAQIMAKYKQFNIKSIEFDPEFPAHLLRWDAPYNRIRRPAHSKELGESIAEHGWLPHSFVLINEKNQVIDLQHASSGAVEIAGFKTLPVMRYIFASKEDEAAFYRYLWSCSKGLNSKEVWTNHYYSGSTTAKFMYKAVKDATYDSLFKCIDLFNVDKGAGSTSRKDSKVNFTASQIGHGFYVASLGRNVEVKADNLYALDQGLKKKGYKAAVEELDKCLNIYHRTINHKQDALKRSFFTFYSIAKRHPNITKLDTVEGVEEFIARLQGNLPVIDKNFLDLTRGPKTNAIIKAYNGKCTKNKLPKVE